MVQLNDEESGTQNSALENNVLLTGRSSASHLADENNLLVSSHQKS